MASAAGFTGWALAALLTACSTPAWASVDGRQCTQAARIRAGARSGALTAGETARLRAQAGALRAEERYYRRDGVLGPLERAALQRDLNRLNRNIRLQKHDPQIR